MRSSKGLTLVGVALVLAVASPNAGAGPRTVTNHYTVGSSGVPGVTTDLVLQAGQSVTVTATGTVCPWPSYCLGPAGNAGADTTSSAFGGFVLPGAPAWGLVGRVGSGPWKQVGAGPTTLSGTGVLVFAMNDDLWPDNSGSFQVTVTYTCWPGWGYGDKNHTHCGPPGLAGKQKPAGKPQETPAADKPKQAPAADERGQSAEAHEDHGREEGKPRGNSGK